MDFSSERAFLGQMQSLHASGGDLNAFIHADYGTRLHHAARRGWCAGIEFLCTHGADVNGKDQYWTPLHCAALDGHCDAAVLLLDAGARVGDPISDGWTALHWAADSGHTNMCQLLLCRGASLDARDECDNDPEALARRHGHTATADFLAAVRAAGGWWGHVDAQAAPQRRALLVLRRALPALRARRAAAPWNDRLLERLFVDVPEDVFTAIFAYWSA